MGWISQMIGMTDIAVIMIITDPVPSTAEVSERGRHPPWTIIGNATIGTIGNGNIGNGTIGNMTIETGPELLHLGTLMGDLLDGASWIRSSPKIDTTASIEKKKKSLLSIIIEVEVIMKKNQRIVRGHRDNVKRRDLPFVRKRVQMKTLSGIQNGRPPNYRKKSMHKRRKVSIIWISKVKKKKRGRGPEKKKKKKKK